MFQDGYKDFKEFADELGISDIFYAKGEFSQNVEVGCLVPFGVGPHEFLY